MIFCDTHTHVYQPDFDSDRNESIEKAISAGVKYHLLPNIDKESVDGMLALTQHFPGNCFPMMGLHPSSVKASFEEEMWVVESLLQKRKWCAIGECGIDLYWDTQFFAQQETVFRVHIEWALQYDLPLVIHSRNSLNEIFRILDDYRGRGLRGVFHCYPGSAEQAQVVIQQGFLLGIGGVVTFKNAKLAKVVEAIPLEYLLLETDAPYLAPEPYRGKRNESSYIPLIAAKIASIKQIDIEQVAETTTANAFRLFNMACNEL